MKSASNLMKSASRLGKSSSKLSLSKSSGLRRSTSGLAVDRGVAEEDEDLAMRARPAKGLYARIVQIDAAQGIDRYCVLQGLEDKSLSGECFFGFQRWGDTGGRGQSKMEGPTSKVMAEAALAKVFQEKTGNVWGTMKPGDRAKPGKYWVQQQATIDLKALWEYYVSDRVDGKSTGWYPYPEEASEEMEDIFAQHGANERDVRTKTRVVRSGYFSYLVDLDVMTQSNTRTKKVRQIRRKLGKASGSSKPMKAKASTALTAKAMNATVKAMKALKVMKAVKVMKAMKKPMKAMKKPMKAMKKPMKAMKVMKVMKKLTKQQQKNLVFKGDKRQTKSRLKKEDLVQNKKGKIVSASRSALGKASKWIQATVKARTELGYTGFKVPKRGTSFHDKATEIYKSM